MIIKVSNGFGGYRMYDNAEEVDLDNKEYTFKSVAEMQAHIPENGYGAFILPGIDQEAISSDNPVRVKIIRFVKLAKPHTVILSTLAYICNDQGRTVEKVQVDGRTRG